MAAKPTLKLGSKGSSVVELQNLLNKKLTPSPFLVPDGDFGSLTKSAVQEYQGTNWLVRDGIVGLCTWNALLGLETFNIDRSTILVPQPDASTCWKAATAMLLERHLPMITNGPAMLHFDGTLLNDRTNLQKYADHHNIRLRPPMSWHANGLAETMRQRGRLLFNIVQNVHEWNPAVSSSAHMVVLVRMRGDGTAEGTTMVFFDPWEPNVGYVDIMSYKTLLKRMPGATAGILHK